MAITPLTGFKAFTFDGVTSTDYGVQILGEGVFNAPDRVVEMIEIPGRNGAYALDKGRFENITVTYPATLIADNVADFAEALSDLRNALCSRRGYCRLEDDYHTDEYRMAVYKSGLEVDEEVLRVGKFNIKFDCKPQRFLTSGETATAVASGGTLTNPTLFEASPMIEAEGYGAINFNGSRISISNAMMGNVQILDKVPPTLDDFVISNEPDYKEAKFRTDPIPVLAYANVGDDFTASVDIQLQLSLAIGTINSCSITTPPTDMSASFSRNGKNVNLRIGASLNGNAGTSSSSYDSFVFTTVWTVPIGPTTYTTPQTVSVLMEYDSLTGEIAITVRMTYHVYSWLENNIQEKVSFVVDSTVQILGHPTYIDCDIGEAYKIESGEVISLNAYIDLGSELPTLAPGSNTITFDNTITSLKVVPRWWKI